MDWGYKQILSPTDEEGKISKLPTPSRVHCQGILKMSTLSWNYKLGEMCAGTLGAISAVD